MKDRPELTPSVAATLAVLFAWGVRVEAVDIQNGRFEVAQSSFSTPPTYRQRIEDQRGYLKGNGNRPDRSGHSRSRNGNQRPPVPMTSARFRVPY